MKGFLLKLSLFVAVVIILFVWIFSRANGYTDAYYLRFTTPPQSNLILGTSRGAQAIQPAVLKDSLGKDFFNYCFTLTNSPYGPVYLNSIKKKLKSESTNSIFILAVDPWSISSITVDPNDITHFRENDRFLDNTYLVNTKPNYEYLIKNAGRNEYKQLIFGSHDTSTFLHQDGWLEISVPMDSVSKNKRLEKKLTEYRNGPLKQYKYSSVRFSLLRETILYLSKKGHVYLVRLPIHPKFLEIENELMPDFNEKIQTLIPISNGYLDMTVYNNQFEYVDGNHIYKTSGEQVTKDISSWIKKQEMKK